MSATSLIVVSTITVIFEMIPITCHRLITNPYPEREYDSIIVQSDPIKVRERKANNSAPVKSRQAIRARKRSFDECPENDFKCLYGEDEDDKDNNKIVDKFLEKYSNMEVKYDDIENKGAMNETEPKEGENPRKSYWSMMDSQPHHHPYDDKTGWVTLDPVPWSTSKISKWHPNKVVSNQDNKPWEYGASTQRPVHQFWVSGSSFSAQRPTTHWGIGNNDIITDNKPSDFPSGNFNGYGGSSSNPNNRPDNGYYEYPGNFQNFQQNQGYKSNHPTNFQQNSHPSTYPSSGNGEWVLLSTTKGYSMPQRHRWAGKTDSLKFNNDRSLNSRKIKPVDISRYHEEDLTDKFVLADEAPTGNRKSDSMINKEEGSKEPKMNTTEEPIQILYTGSGKADQPFKTVRRKVRLHVLPAIEPTTTSHGGLLEVDSASQTVDEAQQEDEKMNKLKTIANVRKTKIRGYKLVPVAKTTGKSMTQKGALTLAAVGAGMIPATMAILLPMALGRRKRSTTTSEPISHGRIYAGRW